MCLAPDRQGNILAGSAPNGLIYRVSPQGKAFILYQTGLPEIHDLVTDSEGRIYAAALGSAAGKGTPEFFVAPSLDRKSTRLNSSHGYISYAVFCLKKKRHRVYSVYK